MNDDTRRAPRREVTDQVLPVTDALAEAVIGRLGNISETGLLMMCSVPMTEDGLYQLRVAIPGADGQPVQLDVGVHHLWNVKTNAPGQSWAGFRFLTISREHRDQLRAWIAEESSAV